MKKQKMFILFLIVALIAGTFIACGGNQPAQPAQPGAPDVPAPEPQVTLRFASLMAETSQLGITKRIFRDLVESRSENITVQLFYNGILGNESELCESVSAGSIDIVSVGSGIQIHLPNAAIMEAPFLFDSLEQANMIFQDPRFIELHTRGAAENNIVPLGYFPFGNRVVFADRPIRNMSELQALRIRIPNIPLWLQIWDSIGANYVALPLSELVPALEQGVIDGQDGPVNQTITNGSYELSSYVIMTNHMMANQLWLINSDSLGSLSPQNQQIILDSAREAIQTAWSLFEAELNEELAYLETVMTVITPDESFLQDMRDAVVAVYEWFETQAPNGREILDLVAAIKQGN